MISYGCEQFDPLEGFPSVRAISVHLSRIMRFAGGVIWPVSLHSCVVADLLVRWNRPDLEIHGLLHDAAEVVTNDIPRDFKEAVPQISVLEDTILLSIYRGLGVSFPAAEQRSLVKQADVAALAAEMRLIWPAKLRTISETARKGHREAEEVLGPYLVRYIVPPAHRTLLDSNGPACRMFRARLRRAIKNSPARSIDASKDSL